MTFGEACAIFGVPWSPETAIYGSFPWDGAVMHGKNSSGTHGAGDAVADQEVVNLWHELAHWLIAEPKFRGYSQFGLSGSVAYDRRQQGEVIPDEEPEASLLGIWMQWTLGADLSGAKAHAVYHGWKGNDLEHDWAKRAQSPGLSRAVALLEAAGFEITEFTWSVPDGR